MHRYVPLLQIFKIPQHNKDYHKLSLLSAAYICPGPNDFRSIRKSQQQLVLDSNLEPYEQ